MKESVTIIIVALICILVLAFAGLIAASFYFYNFAIKRSQKDFLNNNEDLQGNNDVAVTTDQVVELEEAEWVESQTYETWTITSNDGLKLVGYYLPAKNLTTNTVILAHGYSSSAKFMGTFAKFYYEKLGYNVLMPDARGHGESEGNYIGFGWPERKDYLLWIQKVIDTVGADAQIVLHGASMGGATVMMVSGEELPDQVKVIVDDCGYTSAYDELSYQLKRMYHLPSFPILTATSVLTNLKVGYNFYEASSLKQVKKSKLPMLFIHGSDDTFVPTEMVYKVYKACNTEKDLLIVDGAGHVLAYTVDKETYETKVTEFIGRFIH